MAKASSSFLSSVEAAAIVGGGPKLRNLVRTGKLRYYDPFGGTSLRSMRFTQADLEAAMAIDASARVETVYVVGFGAYVKIGFSMEVNSRMLMLQQHLPVDLVHYADFPGTRADEAALHRRFANLRLKGEWFQKRGRMITWINAGCPI